MSNRSFEDQLREEIEQKELPLSYVERFVREVTEHKQDIVDEEIQNGRDPTAAERRAERRLGDPSSLVDETTNHLREAHYPGRYPFLSFFLMPVLVLFSASYLSSVTLQGILAWSPWLIEQAGMIPTSSSILTVYWLFYGSVKYLVPIVVLLGFLLAVRQYFWGWKGAMLVLASLGVFTLCSQIQGTPPRPEVVEGTGAVVFARAGELGIELRTGFRQIAQSFFISCTGYRLGFPIVASLVFYLEERLRRRDGFIRSQNP